MNILPRASAVSTAINKTMTSFQSGQILSEKLKPSEFIVKIANNLEEREAVFQLGYEIYLEKGFIGKNPNQWLIKNYDLDNDTVILMVQDLQKNIVGSVTLVFDESSHLPAEKIYSKELKTLRASGTKMVELSRLVISPKYRNLNEILILLFNYAAIYVHKVKKYNCLSIQVNPRHKNYYKSLLNFEELGAEKPCPQVQNAPAVLLYITESQYLEEVKKHASNTKSRKKERSLYPYFIKPEQESLVAYYLDKQVKPMTLEEKLYFGFSDSSIGQAVTV
jgi:hypothetical protein